MYAVESNEVTPGWRLVSIGFEGAAVNLGGVNPWQVEWHTKRQRIRAAHPQYTQQRHDMDVYEVVGEPSVRFAAGEFSNGVWGFYVPDPIG